MPGKARYTEQEVREHQRPTQAKQAGNIGGRGRADQHAHTATQAENQADTGRGQPQLASQVQHIDRHDHAVKELRHEGGGLESPQDRIADQGVYPSLHNKGDLHKKSPVCTKMS